MYLKKLKIIFAGTEYFSAAHLNALINSDFYVVSVISQPDRAHGRGQKIILSPVKEIAMYNKIPILQPLNLNDEVFYQKLLRFNADIMIVVSYGKIVPKKILSIFPKGCINIHASLLPRWRGATPIQSSILHGDKQTGISIMNMNETIDTGTIIHTIKCNISSQDTTQSLSWKLIKLGIQGILEVLDKINNNIIIIKKKQNEKNVSLSKKIYKKDALLNWNIKAEKLERLIRAFNPWPVCYFVLKNKTIKVWQAKVIPIIKSNFSVGEILEANKYGIQINTSYQILNIQKLQFPGKKITDVENILTSKKNLFKIGTII